MAARSYDIVFDKVINGTLKQNGIARFGIPVNKNNNCFLKI